jgi:hypothetical protein
VARRSMISPSSAIGTPGEMSSFELNHRLSARYQRRL